MTKWNHRHEAAEVEADPVSAEFWLLVAPHRRWGRRAVRRTWSRPAAQVLGCVVLLAVLAGLLLMTDAGIGLGQALHPEPWPR